MIREDTTHILILTGASALGRALDQVCHRLEYAKKILGPQNRILTGETLGRLLKKGYVEPLKKQYPGKKLAVILNQQGPSERAGKSKSRHRSPDVSPGIPSFQRGEKETDPYDPSGGRFLQKIRGKINCCIP